jgi:hypothetical protein
MGMYNGSFLGTSLHSFTDGWQQQRFSFDKVIAEIVRLNLGSGIEVANIHSILPPSETPDTFARYFRALLDRNELLPSCLRVHLTPNDPSPLNIIQDHIAIAQQFGFPIISIPFLLKPDLLEKILPMAEKTSIHVACEFHAPMTFDNPDVTDLVDYFQKIHSPALGLIPDFSCTMMAIPDAYWRKLQNLGASDELIRTANGIWKSKAHIHLKMRWLEDACKSDYASAIVLNEVKKILLLFGRMPLEDWPSVLPYVRHIHGSFFEVALYVTEPTIPYPQLLGILEDAKYAGTISAKWEGQILGHDSVDFQQVLAWHVMCKRLLLN